MRVIISQQKSGTETRLQSLLYEWPTAVRLHLVLTQPATDDVTHFRHFAIVKSIWLHLLQKMGLRRILSESEINMKSIEPQQQQSRLSCNSCSDGYWNSSCCVHDDSRRLTSMMTMMRMSETSVIIYTNTCAWCSLLLEIRSQTMRHNWIWPQVPVANEARAATGSCDSHDTQLQPWASKRNNPNY